MALTALHQELWGGGWSWPLPGDATCARRARALVVDTLATLAVPEETIDDAELMVSELAANAHQHAGGHVPFELWLTVIDRKELYCAIFDTLRVRALPGPMSANSCDFGRGLGIVAELSRGHWGMSRAWSQRLPRVAGKAVWFGCPVEPSTGAGLTWDVS
jgi:hypothetical protein